MSSVSKPRVRHNRHKQGLNLTLEKLSADFRIKKKSAGRLEDDSKENPRSPLTDFDTKLIELFDNTPQKTSEILHDALET